LIVAITAAVYKDGRQTIIKHSLAFGLFFGTIHKTLHDHLGLSKKLARWVPKLLNDAQKNERVRMSQSLVAALHSHSMEFLNIIIARDKINGFSVQLGKKKTVKKWLKKGKPGPMKAKVQASRNKVMVLSFFDSKGLIFQMSSREVFWSTLFTSSKTWASL